MNQSLLLAASCCSVGPAVAPTRAALVSGRYQQRIGNEDLTNVTGSLSKAVVTLPQRLKAAARRLNDFSQTGSWPSIIFVANAPNHPPSPCREQSRS